MLEVNNLCRNIKMSSAGGTIWRYAPGPPDVTGYRDYGNLAARLVSETSDRAPRG